MSTAGRRGHPTLCAGAAFLLATQLACAGPIEVYREGPRYCPHDRGASAPVISEAEAIERARALLPAGYCDSGTFVSGCDVLAEYALGSWRIYFRQYRTRGTDHVWRGLTHTYIVLDPRGNCYANIPGTEEGAPR